MHFYKRSGKPSYNLMRVDSFIQAMEENNKIILIFWGFKVQKSNLSSPSAHFQTKYITLFSKYKAPGEQYVALSNRRQASSDFSSVHDTQHVHLSKSLLWNVHLVVCFWYCHFRHIEVREEGTGSVGLYPLSKEQKQLYPFILYGLKERDKHQSHCLNLAKTLLINYIKQWSDGDWKGEYIFQSTWFYPMNWSCSPTAILPQTSNLMSNHSEAL